MLNLFKKANLTKPTLESSNDATGSAQSNVSPADLDERRAKPAPESSYDEIPSATSDNPPAGFIDVRQLIKELSVEELNQTAEDYFAKLEDWDYHLAKPFAVANETSELIAAFAQVIQGLSLVAGMTVLDFGAGTGWASRLLTQLDCEVISLDVSSSALKIAQELYKRQPVIGSHPESKFLRFDGHRIDLPDGTVDRIVCLDAFHHVANVEQVLREMARVLREGGIAAFSEPGPEHSKSPQSQYEMRMYKVVENDIVIQGIWEMAQRAGFTDVKLAVYNPILFTVSLKEFEEYLDGGAANQRYADETRNFMRGHRVFFLSKGEAKAPDSRQRAGLLAQLKVSLASDHAAAGKPFTAYVTAINVGTTTWLPTTSPKGPVHLGTHLLTPEGALLSLDYSRHVLTPSDGRPVLPGESVTFTTAVPSPNRGQYILEFDLVSERVCWFEHNGSPTVKIEVEVV